MLFMLYKIFSVASVFCAFGENAMMENGMPEQEYNMRVINEANGKQNTDEKKNKD